jgi:hypothetical protein
MTEACWAASTTMSLMCAGPRPGDPGKTRPDQPKYERSTPSRARRRHPHRTAGTRAACLRETIHALRSSWGAEPGHGHTASESQMLSARSALLTAEPKAGRAHIPHRLRCVQYRAGKAPVRPGGRRGPAGSRRLTWWAAMRLTANSAPSSPASAASARRQWMVPSAEYCSPRAHPARPAEQHRKVGCVRHPIEDPVAQHHQAEHRTRAPVPVRPGGGCRRATRPEACHEQAVRPRVGRWLSGVRGLARRELDAFHARRGEPETHQIQPVRRQQQDRQPHPGAAACAASAAPGVSGEEHPHLTSRHLPGADRSPPATGAGQRDDASLPPVQGRRGAADARFEPAKGCQHASAACAPPFRAVRDARDQAQRRRLIFGSGKPCGS